MKDLYEHLVLHIYIRALQIDRDSNFCTPKTLIETAPPAALQSVSEQQPKSFKRNLQGIPPLRMKIAAQTWLFSPAPGQILDLTGRQVLGRRAGRGL